MHLNTYRILATYIIVIVAIICTIFYAIGNVNTRDEIAKEHQIPAITFNAAFALGILYFSLLCFIYAIFNLDVSTIGVIFPSVVLLVSIVVLYIKLYRSLKTGDVKFTDVQTFTFNIFINTIILMINTLLSSQRFITSTLALFPLLGMSIYFLYIGHLLAE